MSEDTRDDTQQAATPRTEDPFRLLDDLLEESIATWPPRAVAAFAVLVQLPPAWRSLRRLRERLESEWGSDQAPHIKTLESWSATLGWQDLIARYEAKLLRLRAELDEMARRQHNEELRQRARELREIAFDQGKRMIEKFNEPLGDVSTWPVNPRTQAPIPPKRSLAGLQAVAQLWKEAVAAERLGLSLPTSIADNKLAAEVHTEQTVVLTLEQWRTKSARERVDGAQVASASVKTIEAPPALPSPAPQEPHERRHVVGRGSPGEGIDLDGIGRELGAEALEAGLPERWFTADTIDPARIVEAGVTTDPLAATRTSADDRDDDDGGETWEDPEPFAEDEDDSDLEIDDADDAGNDRR